MADEPTTQDAPSGVSGAVGLLQSARDTAKASADQARADAKRSTDTAATKSAEADELDVQIATIERALSILAPGQ